MDRQLRRVFMWEISQQSEFGERAAAQLDAAVDAGDNVGIWYAIHALLAAAANVSKILWPPSSGAATRGAELRSALSLTDASALFARTARNHLEHLDERIEEWFAESERKSFVDAHVGQPNSVGGIGPGDVMRLYDPNTGVFHFRGDTWDLAAITAELASVGVLAYSLMFAP